MDVGHEPSDISTQEQENSEDRSPKTEDQSKDSAKTLKNIIQEMVQEELEFIVSYHTNEQATEVQSVTEEGTEENQGWNVKEIIETAQSIFQLTDADKKELEKIEKEEGNGKFDEVKARKKIL